MDDDLVFEINNGAGEWRKVFVTGPPEEYRVAIFDPERNAYISIDKCDWERIVLRVKAQFE